LNVFIRIKAAGKRRDMLEKRPQLLPGGIDTVEKLIAHLVRENVAAYNQKTPDKSEELSQSATPFFPYLTQKEFDDGVYTGKVSFGYKKNENLQDEDEAVKNALQCFADGIYRVLVNETEAAGAGAPLSLKEGDVLTLIRLVMLAGRRF
jgi:hypothetical protein